LIAAILDVDGTLVDTNYHHAIAWYRAFRKHEIILPIWRIHRHIGMGGDQLVPALAGDNVEARLGDDIRNAQGELYMDLINEVSATQSARELLKDIDDRRHPIVLASSARAQEVDHYLDLLDARDIVSAWTTSDDVAATKPAPDLVQSALQKADVDEGVLVGDSPFDCESAARAGVETIAVLTGGFSEQELRDAGAVDVYDSLTALRSNLDATALA
jgi:beta-phosphoglucomutase-like phosphatase (HAD superfamily)